MVLSVFVSNYNRCFPLCVSPWAPLFRSSEQKAGLNLALSFVCFLCASCDCVSAKRFSTEKKIADLPYPLETTPPLAEEQGFPLSEFWTPCYCWCCCHHVITWVLEITRKKRKGDFHTISSSTSHAWIEGFFLEVFLSVLMSTSKCQTLVLQMYQ